MKKVIILIICQVFFLTSCDTTKIVCNNPQAKIYVDGIMKGNGSATINRTGPPKKILVEARYDMETIGSIEVKRQFTWASCLVGCYTYGLGLILVWQFPATITIPLRYEIPENKNEQPGSVWDRPPGS